MPLNTNNQYLIGLNHFPKFGPVRLRRLTNYFPDFKSAWEANSGELGRAGIENNIALEFTSARNQIDIEDIMKRLSSEGIKTVSFNEAFYPALLKEIYDPPPLLYYKGSIENISDYAIAVVGTRKFSPYGKQATEKLVSGLVASNLKIISGLALGIDTIAHNTCLEAAGKTVAVLGTGIDKQSIYPSSNRFLAENIVSGGGAVITEFPLGTQPLKHNFPMRNRIISGLSLGTLVVEAGEKSGALITASCALDQNREVFAVPGNIFSPVSLGPNSIIKQGAKAVNSALDILESLNLKNISTDINPKSIEPETKEEEIIIPLLSHEPIHVDEIVRLSGLDTAPVASTLTLMEIKGMVRNTGNMCYVLAVLI